MNTPYARFIIAAIVAAGLALCLSSCWYTKQAAVFLSERARAIPVERVAADPASSEKLQSFLGTVDDIREFAVSDAGLKPTHNYTRYVAIDKEYVADVVSACASDSFERHYWRFPIVGSMPYKGFYDKADADKEAAKLKAAGLDVIVRKVDAFSSLGYFKDPLYSFMVDYDEDIIAETILHESAHATLFIKGADQFNEEFATFVGRTGTELYLNKRYGADSGALARRRERRDDGEAFVAFLKETSRQLEAVYSDSSLSVETKLARKATVLAERSAEYRASADSLFKDDGYRSFDMGTINNAYIDLYRLYEEDLSLYQAWFDAVAGGSLPVFVATVAELAAGAKASIKSAMAERLALDAHR